MYGLQYSGYPYDRPVIRSTGGAGGTAYSLSASQGSYALTGQSVTLKVAMPATQGSYSLTGQAVTLGIGQPASQGSYTLTGQAVTFTKVSGGNLAANQGSYSLTGNAATLTKSLKVSAAQGSYSLTGQAATPKVGMPVVQGSYSLTGKDVTLTKTGANLFTLALSQGSYHIAGHETVLTGPFVGGGGMGIPRLDTWGQPKKYGVAYPTSRQHNPVINRNDEVKRAAAHMSKLGGEARAASLTAKQRTTIASNAAKARWK